MISTATAIQHLAQRLQDAPWAAVDTEADSRHCYFEKLCLLQVSHPGCDDLVDTLAGLDLAPVFAALQGKELILHGADFDLRILRREAQFTPSAIFDTDLAARLAGVRQTGLGALVHRHFGVQLDKASQKADWGQRPLPERLVRYAIADTHYLKPLADILRGELERLGRLDWLHQCCADLIKRSAFNRERDPEMEWRVKGWTNLGRHAQAVLRELWHWREQEAQATDRPPFHILQNERMVALAGAAIHRKPLDGVIPKRMHPDRRARLLEAVRRGQETPPAKYPSLPRRERMRPVPGFSHRLNELRTARDTAAQQLDMDPTLIASRATLEGLAAKKPGSVEALLPWQRELLKL